MFAFLKQIAKRVFPFRVRVYRTNTASIKKAINAQSAIEHNSQAKMNEFFSDTEKVAAYLGPNRLAFYDDVINLLLIKGVTYDGKNIADVGCGPGYLLMSIHNRFSPLSLTGFDFSESALDIARNVVPDAKFYCLDIYDGTNLKFDITLCTELLEHLLYPDRALKNLLGMIGAAGTLLITVPNGRTDTYEGHINFWSPESWEVFIQNLCAGFDVEVGELGNNVIFAMIRK